MSQAAEQGLQVTVTPLTEADALYHRYPAELRPQPAVLALDLENGELTARYNPAIGSGYPERVAHDLVLWFTIPTLTAEAANHLMYEVKPLAQRILDGARIEWDGHNHVGRFNAEAAAAMDDLSLRCAPDRDDWEPADMVEELEAGSWYGDITRSEAIDRFDLTADTTDEQIAATAADEEAQIRNEGEAGYTVVTGLEEYLTGIRDELRNAKTNELEGIVEQINELLDKRDKLVSVIRGWDTLSDEKIGELIGKSKFTVAVIDKKVRAEQQKQADLASLIPAEPKYPEGTPEHEQYRAELKTELDKFARREV